jgi:formylglycine-generating enzyme required for sulfatase activity
MGSEKGEKDEQPVHRVCFTRPFWLDKYEVTNAQFEAFGGAAKQISGWTDVAFPRQHLNWNEASAYCALRGARLPTEAEWEYAARGPDNLAYPWGNDFVAENLVYALRKIALVGSKANGVSWVGAYDMSGNAWEWVNDWYRGTYYSVSLDQNPQGPGSGSYRVLRGSSWAATNPNDLRGSNRNYASPTDRGMFSDLGVRCARNF